MFEIEEIGAFAPRPDLAGSVDHEGFAQPALYQRLSLPEKLPQFAVGDEDGTFARGVQVFGQRARVAFKIAPLVRLIGFGRRQGRADNAPHPVREPAFQTHIHGQAREDRDGHGGDQRDQSEDTGQTQVQAGTCRFGPPRRDHRGDPRQDKRRDDQHVDKVGQKNESQREGRCRPVERTEHKEGQKRKNGTKDHQPKGRSVLITLHPPETAQFFPGLCPCAPRQRVPPNDVPRNAATAHIRWP